MYIICFCLYVCIYIHIRMYKVHVYRHNTYIYIICFCVYMCIYIHIRIYTELRGSVQTLAERVGEHGAAGQQILKSPFNFKLKLTLS